MRLTSGLLDAIWTRRFATSPVTASKQSSSWNSDEDSLNAPVPVIYIGGVGRSGSTLVERWLGERLRLATPGELDSVWAQGVIGDELCGCGLRFHECEFWNEVGHQAFGGWTQELAEEVLHLQEKSLRLRRIALVWSLTRRGKVPTSLRRLQDINYELIRTVLDVSGCDGVVDASKKLPRFLLLSNDPRLRCTLLNIVRNPQGVIASWSVAKSRPHSGATRTEMARRHPLPVALEWLIVNGAFGWVCRGEIPIARLRFEDFLADPEIPVRFFSNRFARRAGNVIALQSNGEINLSPAHGMGGNSVRFSTGKITLVK